MTCLGFSGRMEVDLFGLTEYLFSSLSLYLYSSLFIFSFFLFVGYIILLLLLFPLLFSLSVYLFVIYWFVQYTKIHNHRKVQRKWNGDNEVSLRLQDQLSGHRVSCWLFLFGLNIGHGTPNFRVQDSWWINCEQNNKREGQENTWMWLGFFRFFFVCLFLVLASCFFLLFVCFLFVFVSCFLFCFLFLFFLAFLSLIFLCFALVLFILFGFVFVYVLFLFFPSELSYSASREVHGVTSLWF